MPNIKFKLRQIRDTQRAAATLTAERDWLVRQALSEGEDEREVARAAGVSLQRVRDLGSVLSDSGRR
jgi:hypothetical protein